MSAVVRQVGFGNEMGKCNTHPRCATRYKLSARHGYLAGRRQARLDYQKEARLAVAQLAKSIGVAVHTISWFTWKAKHRGSLLAKKDAEDYDNAMKEIFPDLTGSLATLAAFSPAAYTRAKDIAKEIYSLDEEV